MGHLRQTDKVLSKENIKGENSKRELVTIFDENSKLAIENVLITRENKDKAVLYPTDIQYKQIIGLKTVKFCENFAYAEMYQGEVIKEGSSLALNNIKNISASMRGDFKMKITFNSTIKNIEEIKSDCIKIQVLDISCGGMGFKTKMDLDSVAEYQVLITFTAEPLLLNFKLLRKEKIGDEFNYGCKFTTLSDVEEIMLRKGIFFMQKKLHFNLK